MSRKVKLFVLECEYGTSIVAATSATNAKVNAIREVVRAAGPFKARPAFAKDVSYHQAFGAFIPKGHVHQRRRRAGRPERP